MDFVYPRLLNIHYTYPSEYHTNHKRNYKVETKEMAMAWRKKHVVHHEKSTRLLCFLFLILWFEYERNLLSTCQNKMWQHERLEIETKKPSLFELIRNSCSGFASLVFTCPKDAFISRVSRRKKKRMKIMKVVSHLTNDMNVNFLKTFPRILFYFIRFNSIRALDSMVFFAIRSPIPLSHPSIHPSIIGVWCGFIL